MFPHSLASWSGTPPPLERLGFFFFSGVDGPVPSLLDLKVPPPSHRTVLWSFSVRFRVGVLSLDSNCSLTIFVVVETLMVGWCGLGLSPYSSSSGRVHF